MSSFTFEQLREVTRIYAGYLRVHVHQIKRAESCPANRKYGGSRGGNYAHAHTVTQSYYAGKRPVRVWRPGLRIVKVQKGTICFREKVFTTLNRREQIQLVIHELHHLVRGKGALSHRSNVFQERARLWAYGCAWGVETDAALRARYAITEDAKKDIETATEIVDTEAANFFISRGLPYREN